MDTSAYFDYYFIGFNFEHATDDRDFQPLSLSSPHRVVAAAVEAIAVVAVVAALGVVELKLLPLAVVKVDSEASEVQQHAWNRVDMGSTAI